MEIELNTSRIAKRDLAQPVGTTQQAVASPVSDAASFPSAESLEAQMSNLPNARADKVAQAQTLIADSKYPPNDLLDRIAVLLALNQKQ